MSRGTAAAAAFLLIGSAPISGAALAQSSLPWADANPLEGSPSRESGSKPVKRAEAEKPTKPAAAAGPATDAATAGPPAGVPVPEPDPRDGTGEETAGAARLEPAEAKPVEEIPVPETRPAASPPDAPASKPPVGGQRRVEPTNSEDAPNSTEKLKSREPAIDPATSVVAAAAIEDAKTCERELKARGAVFTVGESISEGECGVLRPVAIERLSSGVKVGPKTRMLCRTALALDTWMSDVVMPAARADFPERKLTEFRQASTYVCRPRASETGISEHARGSAIDIGAFAFDKGEDVGMAAQAPDSPAARFQDAIRTGACGPFKTVLGPGTDPDHATHFHLDIAARKNGGTYCK